MELQWKSISSSSFPTDLLSEILLRLGEKSIARFRCVSKLWLSITTDPYFISLFENRNPRPRLLLCLEEGDELVVSSIPQHNLTLDQNWRKSYSFSQPTRMKFPEFLSCTASVHGLICFRTAETAIVWNPSTSTFITLPEPGLKSNNIAVFLGYDEVECKHKVIVMPSRRTNCIVCKVITLGGSSWRTLKTNQKFATGRDDDDFGQCINGFIYFLASTNVIYPRVTIIMRFDVRNEKLDVIQLPSADIRVDMLITYEEGKLACLHKQSYTKKKNGITLSILEDADENNWSSKDFLAPYTVYDQISKTNFGLRGFTLAGEFIYRPFNRSVYHKSVYALFFDPVRNKCRRFGFKEIADDKKRRYPLHVFPNHIHTQMSL